MIGFIKSFVLLTQDTGIKIGIIGMAKQYEVVSEFLEENTKDFRDLVFQQLSIIPNERFEPEF